jgi:cytochrome c-type biogenesis protein CcmH/NrfF
MPKYKARLTLTLLLAATLIQGVTPLANPEVRRIGEMLRCMCGSCNYTLTSCNMMSCHGAAEGRPMLLAMVEKGLTEQQILDEFVKKYGTSVLTKPPAEGFNLVGWIMPGIAIGAGLMFIYWFIQRMRKPAAPLPELDPQLMARYQDSIEKDLAKLE